MSHIKIIIDARIEEAIAKGIGPGARMIAKMLGSKAEPQNDYYNVFAGGQLLVKADVYSNRAFVYSPGMNKVFEQDKSGKVELFIPGDWEDGFHYLLGVAIQDLRTAAKKESMIAEKKRSDLDQSTMALWKLNEH